MLESAANMLLYAWTIFLSAFLLFQVQLIIAKFILPWFGGSPAVFNTCMVFFQAGLLAGYAYSDVLMRRQRPLVQRNVHLLLLGATVALLLWRLLAWVAPITPGGEWKPGAADDPVLRILALLAVSVGLPFFTLSTTGPLLQAWFGRAYGGISPYRLYAVSNAGSLLGLLSYPFMVEPWLSVKTQAQLWSWGYVGFAVCCGYLAWRAGSAKTAALPPAGTAGVPWRGTRLLWLALAAIPSVLLLATTNQICQDIAVVPLLWVLPLALYLLSFILCFGNERWYRRNAWFFFFGVATVLLSYLNYAEIKLPPTIGIYGLVLFASCMVCHGELVRLKPAPEYLTSFYLTVASGGAAGGVFVALVAPQIFPAFWEFQLGLLACWALVLWLLLGDDHSWLYRDRVWLMAFAALTVLIGPLREYLFRHRVLLASIGLALVVLVVLGGRMFAAHRRRALSASAVALLVLGVVLVRPLAEVHPIARIRNFYGTVAVVDHDTDQPLHHAYLLQHGQVAHGFQFRSEIRRNLPGAYYGMESGVGIALRHHPRRASGGNLRVGAIGLGVGTIATYGQPGDYIRFYEINPAVIRLAGTGRDTYFSFLRESRATVELAQGDARLSLEDELRRQGPFSFDVLVVDAFSGDAIPIHLLTAEAIALYLRHLAPAGIIAMHITNRGLDLRPVLWRLADRFGLQTVWIPLPTREPIDYHSDWILLARGDVLAAPAFTSVSQPRDRSVPLGRLWTDDYSNLFQILKK